MYLEYKLDTVTKQNAPYRVARRSPLDVLREREREKDDKNALGHKKTETIQGFEVENLIRDRTGCVEEKGWG